ncbi:MAG: hypothetical protein NC833_03065 [Candidatus Omnitrophica bacterium]|nr:hypothetical protein [Candidatus Omnitrophota bacterium]
MRKKKKRPIQYHHPDKENYPNLTYPLWRDEHFRIMKLETGFKTSKHKKFSKGFLMSLWWLVWKYWDKAEDLEGYFSKIFI